MFGKAFINEKETVLTSVLTGLQGGLQSEDQLTSLHVEESNLAVSEGCDQVCWIAADQVHWRGDPQLWHTATEAVVRKANITGGIKKTAIDLSTYSCPHWILQGRGRWCWRPTAALSRPQSRTGGAGERCCRLNPKPSRCVRTRPPAAPRGLPRNTEVSDQYSI